MRTIGDCLSERVNNFDLLRLFAALLVLWSHSYPLTANGSHDVFSKALCGYDLGGSFAVAIFFVISGFLVTRSAATRSLPIYLLARCLRILPALAVCVLVTVLVIGPILTKMPLSDYFRDPSTKAYLGNMLIFDLRFNLADTTQGLPYPFTINGSLWTLSIEFACYILVALLVKCHFMHKRTAIILAGCFVAGFFYCIYGLNLNWQHGGLNIWRGLTAYPILKNVVLFLLGGTLWVYREEVPLSPWIAIGCVLILVLGVRSSVAQAIYILSLPYLVLYVAIGFPVKASLSDKLGDLSYGIYLFAFPLQQTVIFVLGPHAQPTSVSILATAIAMTIAALSWRFVERPALRLKGIGRARVPDINTRVNAPEIIS
jgi:peptidoglycan/LPS O-acetylase OafA/YrhL